MKRLQRKIESTHDYDSRDAALTCINGKVYSAASHAKCINKYLAETGQQKLDEVWSRPEDAPVDKMAFAHLVFGENAIYLEQRSLVNMTLDEAANMLKTEYPAYRIYNDDVMSEDFDDDNYNEYQLLVAKFKQKRGARF